MSKTELRFGSRIKYLLSEISTNYINIFVYKIGFTKSSYLSNIKQLSRTQSDLFTAKL